MFRCPALARVFADHVPGWIPKGWCQRNPIHRRRYVPYVFTGECAA